MASFLETSCLSLCLMGKSLSLKECPFYFRCRKTTATCHVEFALICLAICSLLRFALYGRLHNKVNRSIYKTESVNCCQKAGVETKKALKLHFINRTFTYSVQGDHCIKTISLINRKRKTPVGEKKTKKNKTISIKRI